MIIILKNTQLNHKYTKKYNLNSWISLTESHETKNKQCLEKLPTEFEANYPTYENKVK